jgi:hypothetical protein
MRKLNTVLTKVLTKIGLLVLGVPLLMGADVYRWVDTDGIVNYTQLKPAGVSAQRISTGAAGPMSFSDAIDEPAGLPGRAGAGEAGGGPELSLDQQTMLQDLQAAERARQDEVVRIKGANCVKSRSILNRLTLKDRIRVRDESGSERIMDEAERQRRIGDAQRGIAENCTS